MSLHTQTYEFRITQKLIRGFLEDLIGISRDDVRFKGCVRATSETLRDNHNSQFYPQDGPVGVMLLRGFYIDVLKRSIRGARLFVHPSSGGQLELQEFAREFERFLSKYHVDYEKLLV